MKFASTILTLLFGMTQVIAFYPMPAEAGVADWKKGANVFPVSNTDFNSSSFRQSLQNLKNTGANSVALVIPYYQSNTGSTDIQPGWNTPTDDSLASGIDYAHSLGLSVALKVHLDPYSGDWRAHINPGDRTGWFNNYAQVLTRTAQIGQAHHAEMIVLGTELVSMASSAMNGSNTQNWFDLIGKVRAVYSGALTYDANSTNNNGDPFQDEKRSIGFWSALDYVGLSTYYNLNTSSNDVQSLMDQWNYWNSSDLAPFAAQVGKPILFLEVGYRSIDNSHQQPWNWQQGGGYSGTEQANDYQALLSFWNNSSFVSGVYFWMWNTNPNSGGEGDTGYTPQNKPAQQVMTQWFTNANPPASQPPPNNPPPIASGQPTDIWWPTNGAWVSGVQPFKAMIPNIDVSRYQMFWQVDNGQLNHMGDNSKDWPHKEVDVDVSGWRWRSNNIYTINFVSKDTGGNTIAQRAVQITVAH